MTDDKQDGESKRPAPRSRSWFDSPDSPDMTALHAERYLNYGLSLDKLQWSHPIIGIAQGGDLVRTILSRRSGKIIRFRSFKFLRLNNLYYK